MGLSKLEPSLSISYLFLFFFILTQFCAKSSSVPLRFGSKNGEFKILQVADMHYADGKTTPCKNVLPNQFKGCSDLNTSAFIHRMIRAEKPDLIVFTGDNIFGSDATDAATSLNGAFAPAIEAGIPWAAVLGNHDQESTLSREGVMKHIVSMKGTVAELNPSTANVIDGFGNYNLEVQGVEGSSLQNKSVLNLYLLDSGDYSTVPSINSYGWIKASQQVWFKETSLELQKVYKSHPKPQKTPAPGLAYFHIPLREYAYVSNITGVNKENAIGSARVNSGFFTSLLEAGDVKAVFTGHDHLNDFCGKLRGIHLCYAGGFGYHAYGLAGWPRRARVVSATLERTKMGGWGAVKSIRTWKRLDDENLTTIDPQVLFTGSVPNSCPVTCFRPDPVCGVDGVTYWCGCADAYCAGTKVAKLGFCEVGNGGNGPVSGQALLLVHIVWLIVLGFSVLFGII